MNTTTTDGSKFDFDAHGAAAIAEYEKVRPVYIAFCEKVKGILKDSLSASKVGVASIDARAKEVGSLGEKAVTAADANPEEPKYAEPLKQITDLAGARVITYFPKTVPDVEAVVRSQFDVIERTDKAEELKREERFGYQSIHLLVKLSAARAGLPEYAHYQGLIAEVQIRTILQHAWAEIEHDIQYKAIDTLPEVVGRRFASLAGLLEIADREFQAIQDEDIRLRREARASVREGRLDQVEITPDALKAYLDQRMGPDGRMRDGAYSYEAKILRAYGFTNFRQLDDVLDGFDDDRLSRIVSRGNRQGQLTRFETVLLAALGEAGLGKHPLVGETWWKNWKSRELAALGAAGVPIGSKPLPVQQGSKTEYSPTSEPNKDIEGE